MLYCPVCHRVVNTADDEACNSSHARPQHGWWSVPGQRVGHYTLAKQVGRGGMGAVYSARDGATQVAIKFAHTEGSPQSHPEARQRFEQEANVMKQLSRQDGFVGWREYDSAIPYIVMEWVESPTLDKIISERNFSRREAVSIIRHCAQALHEMHKLKLIHRDMKPSNIFIDNVTLKIKISDFGLTRVVQDSKRPTIACGTPGYMAAEQLYGKAFPQSDTYALGCILHLMLTRHLPVDSIHSTGDQRLDEIIAACLLHNYQDRPSCNVLDDWLRLWSDELDLALKSLTAEIEVARSRLAPWLQISSQVDSLSPTRGELTKNEAIEYRDRVHLLAAKIPVQTIEQKALVEVAVHPPTNATPPIWLGAFGKRRWLFSLGALTIAVICGYFLGFRMKGSTLSRDEKPTVQTPTNTPTRALVSGSSTPVPDPQQRPLDTATKAGPPATSVRPIADLGLAKVDSPSNSHPASQKPVQMPTDPGSKEQGGPPKPSRRHDGSVIEEGLYPNVLIFTPNQRVYDDADRCYVRELSGKRFTVSGEPEGKAQSDRVIMLPKKARNLKDILQTSAQKCYNRVFKIQLEDAITDILVSVGK